MTPQQATLLEDVFAEKQTDRTHYRERCWAISKRARDSRRQSPTIDQHPYSIAKPTRAVEDRPWEAPLLFQGCDHQRLRVRTERGATVIKGREQAQHQPTQHHSWEDCLQAAYRSYEKAQVASTSTTPTQRRIPENRRRHQLPHLHLHPPQMARHPGPQEEHRPYHPLQPRQLLPALQHSRTTSDQALL